MMQLSKGELRAMWDVKYVNKTPSVNDESPYLDLCDDNIINAKDFAVIIR